MAAKSFLNVQQLLVAEEFVKAPKTLPNGDESLLHQMQPELFSQWLEQILLQEMQSLPHFKELSIVATGSWGRKELCPRSDIDMIIWGDEEKISEFVSAAHKKALKLRARVPENTKDWTVGVEAFDVLALFQAVAISSQALHVLNAQNVLIDQKGKAYKQQLWMAMRKERLARAERYDSISNFLEPNLKYGPGGLRDLEQALMAHRLLGAKLSDDEHATKVLQYYKKFFLMIRQKLHLLGANDVLTAPEQFQIANWFGFSSNHKFMREVQKGLSRVSFYADWLFARSRLSSLKIKEFESKPLRMPNELFASLKKDPGILMQHRVRVCAPIVFKAHKKKLSAVRMGQCLYEMIAPETPDKVTVAFFNSRLIDHCVPDFKQIVGYVQHDQYHRFSVDAHLQQALRELKRVRGGSVLRRLKKVASELKAEDWKILTWTCLYHDIAKGRGGDHSELGLKIVKRDLSEFKISPKIINEVAWMVESHLLISEAAFRKNPHSPKTWQALREQGAGKGTRLARLTLFTVVDILATNPEAWTPWKEQLLSDLFTVMKSEQTQVYLVILEAARRAKLDLPDGFVQQLDPLLIRSVPTRILVHDLKVSRLAKQDLEPLVHVNAKKEVWVRFHSHLDRPGLFYEFVQRLVQSGASVRHACIVTNAEFGVYDWFQVKPKSNVSTMKKLMRLPVHQASLTVAASAAPLARSVKFDAIDIVRSEDGEWIFSFRGKDQSGALLAAASGILRLGLMIRWAQVHTWGRQIDDVFCVQATEQDVTEVLESLKQYLNG